MQWTINIIHYIPEIKKKEDFICLKILIDTLLTPTTFHSKWLFIPDDPMLYNWKE